jgi:A/G-specific adenine glycosylase
MLQQTRVTAVLPFYAAFMKRFPTIQALAEASETDLLTYWSGLGYYTRARNMQKAAQHIGSAFPLTHREIVNLPGIGEYTAAAIASIAFGLPHAVVDGNVLRVLSRASADKGDIKTLPTRRRLKALAHELLDRERPGDYNQALMELGATVCLPRSPQCLLCPVRDLCRAHALGQEESFPVKAKSTPTTRLSREVWVILRDGHVLFWQRPDTDRLMPGFWELPEREHLQRAPQGQVAGSFRHAITRFEFTFVVRTSQVRSFSGCKHGVVSNWFPPSEGDRRPISTVARKALQVAGAV